MAQGVPILQAKLMIPRTSDTILRERFRPLMLGIPEKKITTVTAGAGYGKTTLIAQAVRGHDTVWYRLDSLDRDLTTFLHHLIEGVGRVYPGFGGETLKSLDKSQTIGLEYKAAAALFLHELGSTLRKDLMIVLDDYHTVQDTPVIRDSVQLIAENLCSAAHLIIISRSEITLKLSRLRTMREVIDIYPEDLLFSESEIRQFFTELFRITLTDESLGILHAKTAGWISALILFFHSVRQSSLAGIEQEVHRFKGSRRPVSEYLSENVYTLLQPELREFLLKTSILSRLNARFCNRFLGITNAAEILKGLHQSHLFTSALDEEGQEYCYHQLFREFLQGIFNRDVESHEKKRLHGEAARILQEAGEEEEAARHWLLAGSYEQACFILDRISIALVVSSRLEVIGSYLEEIPETCFPGHPWLVFLRSFAHILSGRYSLARKGLDKALALFKERHDQQGIDRCLNTMGMCLYLIGDFHQAETIFEELLKNRSLDHTLRVEATIHLVMITAQLGRMEASDRNFARALMLIPDIEDPGMRDIHHAWLMIYHGFRHLISGDILRALDLAESSREKLQKFETHRLSTLYYQLTSTAFFLNGSYPAGLEEACKGLALSRQTGFKDITYGCLLCHAGSNALGTGKFEEAIAYAEEGLKHFQELGSAFGEAYAYFTLEGIYLPMGALDLAEKMGRACLSASKGLDMPHITGSSKGLMANVLLLRGEYDNAEVLLREAWADFSYSTQFECMVSGLQARLHFQQGRKEDALACLHASLKIAEEHRYEQLISYEWGWQMPLLVELYARGVMRDYIAGIFALAGDNARSGLMGFQEYADPETSHAVSLILKAIPEASPPDLRVCCLGRFRVFKGGEEIPPDRWSNRKAATLFKLLVYYRRKGFVNKEVFMEHLWPEDDPKKSSKRFHVALTTLRRILEPDLKRGLTSAYLKSEGDAYLLDPGKNGSIDLETFEESCRKVEYAPDSARAVECLLGAERLYQGDFLAEDPYDAWCREERDRMRELYLSVLAGIIEFHVAGREHQKAIEYCNKYLAIDKYAEDVYQHLMRVYAHAGNNAMLLKTYELCKDNIINDLGCPLSRKTELLVNELLRA